MRYVKNTMATTGLVAGLVAISAVAAQAQTELSVLTTTNPSNVARMEQWVADYTALHPDVTIDIETRPGGSEGDNLIKTRLATGVMNDVFVYNSGSLFQAINPERNLVALSDEPWASDLAEVYKPVVSVGGELFGAPADTFMGGGIMYNRKIYADLGLEVPTTWADFMANNQVIKDAGIAAVLGTYGSSWTSQLFVLADYHNVQAQVPNFADDYTHNKAKYATTPAAMQGFERLEAVSKAGFMNEDFGAAKYPDGVRMLVEGVGAHFPMLTFAVGAVKSTYPEAINDVGFFAQPADSADITGLTVWMPNGTYIPKSSDNIEAAKDFVAFIASEAGCASMLTATGATGPFALNSCSLPEDVPPAIADLLPYLESGNSTPALEFLSPIKGPALEQITVEVGSGFRSAVDAAALYDQDVKKQAKQLGLSDW